MTRISKEAHKERMQKRRVGQLHRTATNEHPPVRPNRSQKWDVKTAPPHSFGNGDSMVFFADSNGDSVTVS